MTDNEDSVQLSKYCFNICETLKTTAQGMSPGDLNYSARVALEELERCAGWSFWSSPLTISSDSRLTHEIERILRIRASSPHTDYVKEVEDYKFGIKQALGVLNAPPHENTVVKRFDSVGASTSSVAEGGTVLIILRFKPLSQS